MTYHHDSAGFDATGAADRRPSLHEQWREVCDRMDAEDAARAEPVELVSFPVSAFADFAAAQGHGEASDALATDPLGRGQRQDGWTPDRQRAFLTAIADGQTVERACRVAGMSVSSVYAFRQRAAGTGFALGWRAATLLSREAVADALMTRAMDGVTDTVTRPDGSTLTRHRHDNRTALALLARLDRMVEQTPADPAAGAHAHAARLVAQDWEAYLDLLEADRGPAGAGLFLTRRLSLGAGLTGPQPAPQLEPVLALARADAFVRTGASVPEEVDTADLDLAHRSTWTGEQWLRAEAAGLLRVAPAPEPATELRDSPPHPPLIEDQPVRWDEDAEEYRTHLPLPDGEDAIEYGDYGDADYERGLTDREQTLMDRAEAIDLADQRAIDAAEREAWFAQVEADIIAAEATASPAETLLPPTPEREDVDDAGDQREEEPLPGIGEVVVGHG